MAQASLDQVLGDIEAGKTRPIYLVGGDLVLAEPAARRLAEALAAPHGATVERHRRPPRLSALLADLRTFSLFGTAKVVLAVDTALLADRSSAAELIDQAAEALPLADPAAELAGTAREAASRLLQALHVFGLDPHAAPAGEVLRALPDWALKGGTALRKSRPRGRSAKDAEALREGLEALLAAALRSGLQGFAEGDLAELGDIQSRGLPPGHALVLAESSVAADHPLAASLRAVGAALALGRVEAGRGGAWEGLQSVVDELARETGVAIARDAADELARRTLRQSGDWKQRGVEADSTARFAAEFRKLASLAGAGGRITRQAVAHAVEDRGEEDVWQILDALGTGRGEEASARFRRLLGSADDATAARLSFFALLAGFCRQLVAAAGAARLLGVPLGERSYKRFEQRWAARLAGELPQGGANPLAGLHPFRLHRAYLAASRMADGELASLPWWVLETEQRIKGEASDADAAVLALIGRIVALGGPQPAPPAAAGGRRSAA